MEIQNHSFRVTFNSQRDHYMVVSPYEMSYQRNGVSGNGFFVLRLYVTEYFEGDVDNVDDSLIAVVFDYHEWAEDPSKFRNTNVAVMDPYDLDRHYRGDNFAAGIYETIFIHRDGLWS